jgi:hypothetical protein
VDGVASGVINSIAVLTGGEYTIDPTNPVSVTGGSGTGATFNLTMTQVNNDLNPEWRRLGSGRDRVFEVYSDTAIKHAWNDAYLAAGAGRH